MGDGPASRGDGRREADGTTDPVGAIGSDRSIEALLNELTLSEKVGQLNQLNGTDETGPSVGTVDLDAEIAAGRVGSMLNTDGMAARERYQRLAVEESRLGIPLLFGFDVVHGYETVFPTPLAEAASWDRETVRANAAAAAAETAAAGITWTFSPPCDVARDARWGRSMESSGEDPYLAAELTHERVRGYQGTDLAAPDTMLACVKHFVGYGDVLAGREYNTVDVSETALRERHLPPFEAAVEAGVGSVMTAFTDFERVPVGAHKGLLRDLLKDEWGFDGVVVSDWNSVRELLPHGIAVDEREAARAALEAGTDVDMVGHIYSKELEELVAEGTVAESLLDDAVRRVLETKRRLGLFEDPYRYFDDARRESVVGSERHREAAREGARESMVLLENDGMLPLTDAGTVAVGGALATEGTDVLGEWRARGDGDDAVPILAGIENAVDAARIEFVEGYDRFGETTPEKRDELVETVAGADVAVLAVGEPWELSGECSSRTDISLPGDQRAVLEAALETGTPVVTVILSGRPLAIPWTAENVPAVLEAWHPGSEGGNAVADVLFGDHSPSGKLPMSFPRTVGQVPLQYDELPTGRPEATAEPGWSSSYVDCPNDPLYAFGHGLSYTEFAYDDLAIGAQTISPTDHLDIEATVENIGERAGREVVQLYVRDVVGSRSRPTIELAGFEKISLEPGERRRVAFELGPKTLATWTADGERRVESGEFEVFVGRASDDLRLSNGFTVAE
ncbi:glycoside hydrolase family 3 domain protein [Halococcus morrhuae DSM 1307]|uniref:beta-glucosidase n=1 Tax=Halococcus morrhuae DSM 1307 TaxID=931277 RepID=M0MRD9_HALMO|nr:beta-glucosidase BglX [Halococcus morrhuae]EMA47309.1 glycoside hydrolase family 3 domain protein [Halococcus morrhuae DSM 1307]